MITLHAGFKESPMTVALKCRNVWFLLVVAVACAFVTNSIDGYVNPPPSWRPQTWGDFFNGMLSTSNTYLEILAFVPAVWMVYSQNQRIYDDTDCVSTKRKATAFFLFLTGFYVLEDLYSAWNSWNVAKVAATAHVLHFLLLSDFACYVLGHIYNPDKLLGPLRKWLPADLSCDV